LSVIEIASSDEINLVKFYTALYHALLAPTIFDEAGGVYLGFDNQIHKLEPNQKHYYTDMSIWDVHRTEYPFLGLINPTVLSDIVKSLLLMYQQGGYLPRWPLANGQYEWPCLLFSFFSLSEEQEHSSNNIHILSKIHMHISFLIYVDVGYTDCMEGTHAIIVIVDAYMRGFNDNYNNQSPFQKRKLIEDPSISHSFLIKNIKNSMKVLFSFVTVSQNKQLSSNKQEFAISI
jgi:hypothetical protein